MLSGTFVAAQEALQTALDADRSAQARQLRSGGDAERIKAGPVEFNVGLSFETEFNDNVNSSETQRESDVILRPQLDVHGFLPVTKTGRLSLGFGLGYAAYLDHRDLSYLFIRPDSELAYDIEVEDFVFTFYEQFDYSREVDTVGALSGVSQFPRFENTVGTRATWAPSKWIYQAGYAHYNYLSDDADFDYLDRASEQFYARVAYGFAPSTRVGAEATVALTDYSSATRADNRSYSAGPYAEWQVTQWLGLSVHGGVTYFNFEAVDATAVSPPAEAYDLDSFYATVQVDHRLTDYVSHGLSAAHQVEPGVNQGSDYLESTEVSYRMSWSLTKRLTVSGSVLYERGTEPQDGSLGATTEEYQRLGGGLSGAWHFSKRLTATASYYYSKRESNEAGRSTYQNRTTIGFRYQF
jgi:hypothetical protein